MGARGGVPEEKGSIDAQPCGTTGQSERSVDLGGRSFRVWERGTCKDALAGSC